ncbi:MAG: hypothetical protein RIE73_23290 [Coleofasciculus sp. C1-SOL-03]
MTSRLVTIAGWTSQTKIIKHRLSTCRSRYNVFKFKSRGSQGFSRLAVGTTISKTTANLSL